MLTADLDVPTQYLETRTRHASVDEAVVVDGVVIDERHASDEEDDEVARDQDSTSQQQVEGDHGQAEHFHERRQQPITRQHADLKKSAEACGCKGWGGLCRHDHA